MPETSESIALQAASQLDRTADNSLRRYAQNAKTGQWFSKGVLKPQAIGDDISGSLGQTGHWPTLAQFRFAKRFQIVAHAMRQRQEQAIVRDPVELE
jgi:hypothetical protein